MAGAALTALAGRLEGRLVQPGADGFDAVRKRFAAHDEDPRPTAVARCASVGDVAAAVEVAGAIGLPFALRSGGHSFADWSSTRGLLVDLGGLDAVRPDGDLVTVGPGVRLGALAAALARTDRVLPAGWCPDVGVAGAVLGGGYGVLGRHYGLGCDHLVAAQMVLAGGRIVWCDRERAPDLFWALRGAGGGFLGAVTALVLRTRPAVPATELSCTWSWADAAAVVATWVRRAPAAPDGINAELALIGPDDPAEEPYLALFGIATDGAGDFLDLLPPPAEVRTRPLDARAVATHSAYPGVSDDVIISGPEPRPGLHAIRSGFFAGGLPAGAVAALLNRFTRDRVRGEFRDLELVPWGGRLGRVPVGATAFPHRTVRFLLKHSVLVSPRASADRRAAARAWLAASAATVARWGTGGVYLNYAEPGLGPWSPAYHGPNLARLRAVKARYDPAGHFRPGGWTTAS